MIGFSVEVSGEANPLTAAAIQQTLRAAASRDVIQIKAGTEQLQNWESKEGFYTLLQVSDKVKLVRSVCL